jgi:hypothetical protein
LFGRVALGLGCADLCDDGGTRGGGSGAQDALGLG